MLFKSMVIDVVACLMKMVLRDTYADSYVLLAVIAARHGDDSVKRVQAHTRPRVHGCNKKPTHGAAPRRTYSRVL
jgi:hypothetical protein